MASGEFMPEAVIVSIARSPIRRAGKGSLVDMRPDDLAAQMVGAALSKIPELGSHSGTRSGMTGAQITASLLNNLQAHDKQFGLETMCVGGGLSI
jgi:acetyl-CoA acetyltransferase